MKESEQILKLIYTKLKVNKKYLFIAICYFGNSEGLQRIRKKIEEMVAMRCSMLKFRVLLAAYFLCKKTCFCG